MSLKSLKNHRILHPSFRFLNSPFACGCCCVSELWHFPACLSRRDGCLQSHAKEADRGDGADGGHRFIVLLKSRCLSMESFQVAMKSDKPDTLNHVTFISPPCTVHHFYNSHARRMQSLARPELLCKSCHFSDSPVNERSEMNCWRSLAFAWTMPTMIQRGVVFLLLLWHHVVK